MDFRYLIYEQKGSVATIRLNRPQVHNALNLPLLMELQKTIETARKDDRVKVVIISGTDRSSFSSGADLKEAALIVSQKFVLQKRYEYALVSNRVLNDLDSLPKPTIAAIRGYCLGGGCELAICCDFRVSTYNAKFGMPEVNLGTTPGAGGIARLRRLIGLDSTMSLVLSGDFISARQAKRIGLVNRLTHEHELEKVAKKMADSLAAKSSTAVSICKIAIKESLNMPLRTAILFDSYLTTLAEASEEAKGGFVSFGRKKPATRRQVR